MPRVSQNTITIGKFPPGSNEEENFLTEQIFPLINYFVIKLNKSFVINSAHGHIIPPDFSLRKIYLNFYSLPEMPLTADGENIAHDDVHLAINNEEMVLEKDAQGYHWLLNTTDKEEHLIKSQDGTILAEVWWNNIYICYDILHKLNTNIFPFMKYILSQAEKKLDFSRTTWNKYALQRMEKDYIDLVMQDLLASIVNKKQRMETLENQIRSHLQNVARGTSELENVKIEVRAIENANKTELVVTAQKSYSVIQQLIAQGMFTELKVNPNDVTIVTGPIFIEYSRKIYRLGIFKITIRSGNQPDILIKNQEGTKNGLDHPHVQHNRPCWGNIGTGVAKLLGRKDYPTVLQLVHKYLCSYNQPDAYNRPEGIKVWPTVTREEMQKELNGGDEIKKNEEFNL